MLLNYNGWQQCNLFSNCFDVYLVWQWSCLNRLYMKVDNQLLNRILVYWNSLLSQRTPRLWAQITTIKNPMKPMMACVKSIRTHVVEIVAYDLSSWMFGINYRVLVGYKNVKFLTVIRQITNYTQENNIQKCINTRGLWNQNGNCRAGVIQIDDKTTKNIFLCENHTTHL